ncbi:ATP-binding protein [Ilyobacter polytropus]|uniref:histidine kinase n=1 Tax=Ilyobacter polytropus (strain ATCC 51220 / DSM 2926 / LMG 16218 / CuHBu1) TaxID=572544 RepID=E3HAQ7_ILYPC|nr:ATP-binding protein [Ilyobacter polytropus]ADO82058.1 multi-sensor hybrid histidine kinase [Ilyobacter polytropus DSM 2926]
MGKIKLKVLPVIAIAFVILVVGNISYRSFLNYQNIIVEQQMEHLMTISKSIGRSLELYVQEKEKGLRDLGNNIEYRIKEQENNLIDEVILNSLETFYLSQNKEIDNLIYININDNSFHSYPEDMQEEKFITERDQFSKEISYVKRTQESYAGNPYLDRDNTFSFNILEPVVVKDEIVGIILGKIKVMNMYELLVKPVKAGKFGYAMVKDKDGLILMHPVKEQVGYDVIKSRMQKYPGLDYDDLEKLLEKQMSGVEGSYVYYSYWWPQDKLEKVKKLNAFSPAKVSEDFWIVAVVMSYDEISEPIINYLLSNIVIAIVVIMIFSWVIFLSVRMIKNKEAYEMETRYLKEINKSTEELRIKDAELHHKRKLETIGRLTGGIAHEFNNVLTPIMGYSEMVLRNLDPELDSYDYVKTIHKSSKRAQEIIDQIRMFSGDKNIKIKYEIISINKILDDAISFAESVSPSNIKVIKNIDKNCGNVYANETQIHQVVLNLCTNAFNAMKETDIGNLKITAKNVKNKKLHNMEENIVDKKEYVKISFEDNGCGMDSETQEKIFDPFFTQKLSRKSSGLGLAIVQGIITKHGGSIEVYSEKGKGSRFDIYIPIAQNIESGKEQVYEDEILRGNEKVLVVDDDEFIAEMLEKGLVDLGYKAESMTDGIEILKKFDYIKNNFKIVITDLTMPEINGIQLAKKIKENNPEIKVILMTAYSEEPLEEYMRLGIIDSYLIKPVSAAQISRSIRELV